MRTTSVEAYNAIAHSLSKRRGEVYAALCAIGSGTAMEIFQQIPSENGKVAANVHARLAEMRDLGVVVERGVRACRVTGMNVIVWESTGSFPFQVKQKRSFVRCPTCGSKRMKGKT